MFIYGISCLGSFLSVPGLCEFDSTLFLRAHLRIGLSCLVYGVSCLGPSLSVPDMTELWNC